ncbi:MAG TPA: hypothetical protein VM509_10100 [Planctomycetota bacterium]|nr:hypothetical protein [Planctomycetota bacterium]
MSLTVTRSITKSLVAMLALLAASCNSTGRAELAQDGRRGEPLELERLQIGSVYGVGSRFASDGIEFAVESFGEGPGNAEISTEKVKATAKKDEGERAKHLLLSHATLRCDGRRTDGLEFDYVDKGGPIALEIGGEKRGADDFIALDGASLGGARIEVSESSIAGVRHGRVSVSGSVGKFAIGGADLEVALRLSR